MQIDYNTLLYEKMQKEKQKLILRRNLLCQKEEVSQAVWEVLEV